MNTELFYIYNAKTKSKEGRRIKKKDYGRNDKKIGDCIFY